MKQELKHHLLPLLVIFIIISLVWLLSKVFFLEFIYLFLGLILGSFFLDIDHLIYWLYLEPNLNESRLAQTAIKNKDYKTILLLLEINHKNHTNLIFHHYFFQVVLSLVSFFVFTSSDNVFGMAFLAALNIHLLVDEICDYKYNPKHLQNWLFAREIKQLPLKYLKFYIGIFIFFAFFFTLLLLKSKT